MAAVKSHRYRQSPRLYDDFDVFIEKFKMFLKNTCQDNPMNMAILGERGIGKSSLLRMCENL